MKLHIKKIVAWSIIISSLFGNVYAFAGQMVDMKLFYDGKNHNYKAQEIKIEIDGKELVTTDMPPIVLEDRTLVPARAVFEEIGAEVAWNADAKEVYVVKDNDIIILKINDKVGIKNGVNFTMDVPAKIVNDRTLIPVRAVSEAIGCSVLWNDKTRVVSINQGASEDVPEALPPIEPVIPDVVPPVVTPPVVTPPSTGDLSVSSVSVPFGLGANQSFTISANKEIAKYENVYVDDTRIVIDVYDAVKKIDKDNITVSTSHFVSAIRSSQNEIEGRNVTRVVFDLKGKSEYKVTQSNDKKSITISFLENSVNELRVSKNGDKDIITVIGNQTLSANVSTLSSPKRIIIDVPYATSQLEMAPSFANLDYVKDIRTSIYGEKTARIVVEITDTAQFNVNQNGSTLVLEIYPSTLKNISYDTSTNTLALKKEAGFNIAQIKHTDNYLSKQYKITLPGDFKGDYGYGTYAVNDSVLSEIKIANDANGNTVFSFEEKKIMAYVVTEDSNNYYIQAKNPKDVYPKILVLDPGHGGTQPGTNGNGFIEKDLNLIVGKKVYALLQNDSSIKVYITRVSDVSVANEDRAKMANDIADLYVSIHMNSMAPNAIPNGTETLYKVHSTDVAGKLTSQIAAGIMQKHVVGALGTNNRGIKLREDLLVLNATKVPAILVEVGFLSNAGDALKITQNAGQDLAAKAIYEAIIEMTSQYKLR